MAWRRPLPPSSAAVTRPARRAAEVLAAPVKRFLDIESAGGLLLLAATVAAVVWANSPWHHGYESLWHGQRIVTLAGYEVHASYGQAVNDGFMVLFFFVMGLEIKREWVAGELRDRRAAALPAVAALGGMVVPALVYLAFNAGGAGSHGWGIPMATDIAFALGALTALGSRVPNGLKLFLLTLAIVDDIGAIVVIALFYSNSLRWTWLALAAGMLVVVGGLRRLGVERVSAYVVVGVVVWFATWRSGVHPTIAGVALGLLTPAVGHHRGPEQSVAARLEERLHPWTGYLIVPVFALANAGVALGGGFHGEGVAVLLGVALGLVVGKTVGVAGATWLVIRLGWADLPEGSRWSHVVGVAVIAGIGFTMSLFVTDLAFRGPGGRELADHAKVAILLASAAAALLGTTLLAVTGRVERRSGPTA